uniref:BOS complex subunit TMEM147 n=1 Tax=Strigamia maritima TaxID=126957 RepID=T1JHP0_STRMM
MTLFHFANCLALAYVPYFMTYKYSGLSEYSAFWKCIQAGIAYVITQLGKMLILATFFPSTDRGFGIDLIGELLKSTVDLADLAGLHFVMTKIVGKGEVKFLVAGIGWATAELLLTRCFPLWVGAKGLEFDWKYIQLSFDSNINLVQHITTATLVWLWSRTDLHRSLFPVVLVLLIFSTYKSLMLELVAQIFPLGSWTVLLVKTIVTLSVGFVGMQLYVSLLHNSNSY